MLNGTFGAPVRLREYTITCVEGHRLYMHGIGNYQLNLAQTCGHQGCEALGLAVQTAPVDECLQRQS